MSQAEVKAYLAANGPASAKDIARALGQSISSATACLARLRKAGEADYRKDQKDKRKSRWEVKDGQ